MTVRVGIVLFPGSNRDIDAANALTVAGAEPVVLWHEDADLSGVAGILLPGGFAYGDYLRAGVIARFSPVMRAVADFAERGGPVLGICNGFQVLAEARLVPRGPCCGTAACGSCARRSGSCPSTSTRRSRASWTRGTRCGCRLPTVRAATTPTRPRWTVWKPTAR